jgi:tungstate transport system permease protein
MDFFLNAVLAALNLISHFDPAVYLIAWTSIKISVTACLLAASTAVILGCLAGIKTFSGKRLLTQLLSTLMAMPTVMIGLILYGLLSRQGPLGSFGLLYSETAVILGEAVLIFPIVMNLTMVAVHSADPLLLPTLKSLGANTRQQIHLVLLELKYPILAAIITGFGRAIAEVGAAMMLGGNIQGSTRTMTTAIALETNKGNFELAMAIGILLLLVAFTANYILDYMQQK